MSPLERLLLATHEERMAAARPKDLPMSAQLTGADGNIARAGGPAWGGELKMLAHISLNAADALLHAHARTKKVEDGT